VKQSAFLVVSITPEIIHFLMETNSGKKHYFHDASQSGEVNKEYV